MPESAPTTGPSDAELIARVVEHDNRHAFAVLVRRHPWSAAIGLYAMFSLAGVPGTPGAMLWLETARTVARAGRSDILFALIVAWLVAFSVAIRQFREAFGRPVTAPTPEASVPWPARLVLWIGGATLLFAGLGGLVS